MALGEVAYRQSGAEHEVGVGAMRKPYDPPRLVRYGDVRDVTLGPSPGTGESGNPLLFRVR